jgi:hypothetical protein
MASTSAQQSALPNIGPQVRGVTSHRGTGILLSEMQLRSKATVNPDVGMLHSLGERCSVSPMESSPFKGQVSNFHLCVHLSEVVGCTSQRGDEHAVCMDASLSALSGLRLGLSKRGAVTVSTRA